MKPYLVHKTWIDLDHVLMISDLQIFNAGMCGMEHCAGCEVTMAFVDQPKPITFGDYRFFTEREERLGLPNVLLKDAAPKYDSFIAAWKAKDDDVKPVAVS